MTPEPEPRRLPAEWEPVSGVMLTWPHEGTDWAPMLAEAEAAYTSLAASIARHATLLVVCRDRPHRDAVRARLSADGVPAARLRLAVAESDDTWARDHGPVTTLIAGRPTLLDFRFDGWGGRHPSARDDALVAHLHGQGVFGETPRERVDLVLEGGAIDSDGRGALLTTRRCLLSGRGHRDQDELGTQLRRYLGVERIHWLDHGHLEGDDTDSHVDTLARFCDPATIAYMRCDDPDDPHYPELAAMETELRALRRADGSPYRLIALPWPSPCFDPEDGHRLPATYANFLIINGAVLVPIYGDAADTLALATLGEAFPDRDIVPIDASTMIRQHGSLHCLTMQLPRGTLDRHREGDGS